LRSGSFAARAFRIEEGPKRLFVRDTTGLIQITLIFVLTDARAELLRRARLQKHSITEATPLD